MFGDVYQINPDDHYWRLFAWTEQHIAKPIGYVMLYGIIIAWYALGVCAMIFSILCFYFCFFG
jgi:ABC-type multidrug transport system permease subunit